MRRVLGIVLLVVSGLLLGCGGASNGDQNENPAPSASPVELLKVTLAAPEDGSELLCKSVPFTTNGGPRMVHLEITERGTAKIYGDVSPKERDGSFIAFLETPGGYWDRETAPHAAFRDVCGLEQGTEKFATQFGAYDKSLPEAGTYVLRVEMDNFTGTVTLLEVPCRLAAPSGFRFSGADSCQFTPRVSRGQGSGGVGSCGIFTPTGPAQVTSRPSAGE